MASDTTVENKVASEESAQVQQDKWLSEAAITESFEKLISHFPHQPPVIIRHRVHDVDSRLSAGKNVAVSGMVRAGNIYLFRDGLDDDAVSRTM